MKTAIVHEWLTTLAGAEKVLEHFYQVLDKPDLFVLVNNLADRLPAYLKDVRIQTSLIQKMPWGKSKYRAFLPLMPFSVEQMDVTNYDTIISSHYCVSHGVITRPDQLHIAYTHSPVR